MHRSQNGFTLVEMLVVITIIGILAALAIPNMTRARNKAKETEVKANLHIIQVALERFHTDHGQYPAYIGGGNFGGWAMFRMRMERNNHEAASWLADPLILQGYLDPSYPTNPFVSRTEAESMLRLTGGNNNAGSGDPRFGANGAVMGNTLDDPRFMSVTTIGGFANPKRTLPNGEEEPVDVELLRLHWWNSRIGEEENLIGRLRYNKGGNINEDGEPVNDWWPGNFFYRAMGDIDTTQTVTGGGTGPMQVHNFRYNRFSTYILGGYGSRTTLGMDVIRNFPIPGETLYEKPRDEYPDIEIAIPEVFGGGDEFTHPKFPPKDLIGNQWIYGAPDGVNDGIVAILTGSGTDRSY